MAETLNAACLGWGYIASILLLQSLGLFYEHAAVYLFTGGFIARPEAGGYDWRREPEWREASRAARTVQVGCGGIVVFCVGGTAVAGFLFLQAQVLSAGIVLTERHGWAALRVTGLAAAWRLAAAGGAAWLLWRLLTRWPMPHTNRPRWLHVLSLTVLISASAAVARFAPAAGVRPDDDGPTNWLALACCGVPLFGFFGLLIVTSGLDAVRRPGTKSGEQGRAMFYLMGTPVLFLTVLFACLVLTDALRR